MRVDKMNRRLFRAVCARCMCCESHGFRLCLQRAREAWLPSTSSPRSPLSLCLFPVSASYWSRKKIFSIFSFATCGGYSGNTSFNVTCQSNIKTISASFGYPFRLNTVVLAKSEPPVCNTTWEIFHLTGDFSSSAEFYVSVAVFAFLYCIGALVLYLGYMHSYRESRKLPMIDFVVTIVFAFLWLVSASAWAKGLTDVKYSTSPITIIKLVGQNCTDPSHCVPGDGPSLGSLNVSVVFGFLNLILWAGNAWFVFKETRLATPPPDNPSSQGPGNIPSP